MAARPFDNDESEALGLLEPVPGSISPELSKLGVRALEFSCRGERVPCRLVTPEGAGPWPLIFFEPDPHADRGDVPTRLEAAAEQVALGFAIASIDLPLHGERRSAKLTELLEATLADAAAGQPVAETNALLLAEFVRQSVLELRRTLDVLCARSEIDASRVGFAGFGVGAQVGALFCSIDARVRAAVLAGAGAGFGPASIDPATHAGGFARRPVLLLNDGSPGGMPKPAATALHEAAGATARVEWKADGWLEAAMTFLRAELRI